MSAITGIYRTDHQSPDERVLERMTARLAHRGPDGTGKWSAGSVGFGHRLLHTTPESIREKLPSAASADLVITADARIDNRAELIAALDLDDRPASAITDSELILKSYEKWLERCPEKLLGDFSFAIWDARRRRLFCARDPMGVKPFYYYHSSNLFAFASEIKALFCLPEVPRRLNELKVGDHFARVCEDRVSTCYEDIRRLPAAHWMAVTPQEVTVRNYWSPDPSREIRLGSNEEYADAFREIFVDAVRCRLRSAFPVGSSLSGGLDSSSIACAARSLSRELGEGPLHTFSAIFPSLPQRELNIIDERRYIQSVLNGRGFQPHFVEADKLSPLAEISRIFWHEDQLFFAPNLYLHWALYGAAQEQGVRVFLDGLDGDTTVFHGWEYLAELTRSGRWMSLAAEATSLSRRFRIPRKKILWEFGLKPQIPYSVLKAWRRLQGHSLPVWSRDSAINPAFARAIGMPQRMRDLLKGKKRTVRESHWLSVTSGMNQDALELIDKAAAAFSIEPRYPFFDRRLIEFCLALPAEQRLHQGWTRVILRRAMSGILPEDVQWRGRKADLSPNFFRQFLQCERSIIEEVILKAPQSIERYVEISRLREAYERYLADPIRKGQDALNLYSAVMLALWLRQAGLEA